MRLATFALFLLVPVVAAIDDPPKAAAPKRVSPAVGTLAVFFAVTEDGEECNVFPIVFRETDMKSCEAWTTAIVKASKDSGEPLMSRAMKEARDEAGFEMGFVVPGLTVFVLDAIEPGDTGRAKLWMKVKVRDGDYKGRVAYARSQDLLFGFGVSAAPVVPDPKAVKPIVTDTTIRRLYAKKHAQAQAAAKQAEEGDPPIPVGSGRAVGGSPECGYVTKGGPPCRRKVKGGGYCYQHRGT